MSAPSFIWHSPCSNALTRFLRYSFIILLYHYVTTVLCVSPANCLQQRRIYIGLLQNLHCHIFSHWFIFFIDFGLFGVGWFGVGVVWCGVVWCGVGVFFIHLTIRPCPLKIHILKSSIVRLILPVELHVSQNLHNCLFRDKSTSTRHTLQQPHLHRRRRRGLVSCGADDNKYSPHQIYARSLLVCHWCLLANCGFSVWEYVTGKRYSIEEMNLAFYFIPPPPPTCIFKYVHETRGEGLWIFSMLLC